MALSNPIRNAMTVDVEDYFQVSAFERHVTRDDWDSTPGRVERNTDKILATFAEAGIQATFFTLGWIAARYPALIRRIAEAGHEVASHGFGHVRVCNQTPAEFAEDVTRTKHLLEDLTGEPVRGYRAASFSIDERTLWALDVLAETGHQYSSSIYPVRHDLYGMPDAPRFAFRHASADILEVPITTVPVMQRNLPCGGGGYFRLLPYLYFKWALARVNREDDRPCVFYFHPWEIDAEQPRLPKLSAKTRFRHYTNLSRTESRLVRLLNDFSWARMDQVFLGPLPVAAGAAEKTAPPVTAPATREGNAA